MRRDYDTGTAEAITYFTGSEVESTPAKCMFTLFVVGLQDVKDIKKAIKNIEASPKVKHIYFGANQSFPKIDTNDAEVWKQWEHMIQSFLDADYWCTLDIDASCVEGLVEGPLVEYRKFIPQISVKIPYLTQLGYNATIKLDDKDFAASNPGVWCYNLRDLTSTTSNAFTGWDSYNGDRIIK